VFATRVAVGVALLAGLVQALPAGAAPAPGFHAPVVMPGSEGGSEPSVAISQNGVRYVTWQAPGQFASSRDGVNFTPLATPDPDANGDTDAAVDAAGAVYDAQICGGGTSLHTCIYRSTDGGEHWTLQSNLADNHPGASDRPWIDVFPKSYDGSWNPDNTTVYLEYHTFSPEDLAYVTVSHDGGRTFSPPTFITSDPNTLDSSFCNTVPSGIVADARRPGKVYALWLSGNDSQSNAATGCNYSQIGPFNKAWVSSSVDDGVTWTSHLAWHGSFDPTTKIGDNASKIFGTIAVDRAGQIHVVTAARHNDDPTTFAATGVESPQPTDLFLASSPDQGAHWTAPVKVNQKTGSYFFPWLAAGSAGKVDAVYYRSTTLRPNNASSIWYLGFSQITDATATVDGGVAKYIRTPRGREVLADPQPAHAGGICTFGLFCTAVSGNRSLADSISIAIDPSGAANLAWTNDYPDGSSTRRVLFACQNAGPAILGHKSIAGCSRATP
jgi:hypothetical protein